MVAPVRNLCAAAALAGLALTQPAALGACGDCNGDASRTILDALLVAQISLGLTAAPGPTSCCDSNADGVLTVIDALLVAQASAGLAAPLSCPVATVTPTNPGGLPVDNLVDYTVANPWGDVADVSVEWSTDGGATWAPATRYGALGEPLLTRASSPAGTLHRFAWDWFADLRSVTAIDADLRFVATICEPGPASTTGPFSFTASLPGCLLVSCLNSGLGSSCGDPLSQPHTVLEVDTTGPGAGAVTQVLRECQNPLQWGDSIGVGPDNLQVWVLNSLGGVSLAWLDRLSGLDILGREILGSSHTIGGRGGLHLSPSGTYMGVCIGTPAVSEFRLYDPYTRQVLSTITFPAPRAGHFTYAGTDDEVWVICDPNGLDTNAHVLDVPALSRVATVPLGPGNFPNDIVYHQGRDSFFISVESSGIGPTSICPDPADVIEVDRLSRSVVAVHTFSLSAACGSGLYADENCDGLALNPAGTLLAVTLANFGRVVILDTATGSLVGAPVISGNSPREVVWDGATSRFYCFNLCEDELCALPNATVAAIDVSGTPTRVGTVDLSPSHTPVSLGQTR